MTKRCEPENTASRRSPFTHKYDTSKYLVLKGGKKMKRPTIPKFFLKTINDTPFLLSILYDFGLLPEQLGSQEELTEGLFAAYHKMFGIVLCVIAIKENWDCLKEHGI